MSRSALSAALITSALVACGAVAAGMDSGPARADGPLVGGSDGQGNPGPASSRRHSIVSRAVGFAVHNTNTSELPCTSDGGSYEVKGHLFAPGSSSSGSTKSKRSVTLYLHGRGFGEFLWNLTSVPSQNYAAAQARKGHTSVVIDRIGYGVSGHPDGNQSCLGSQADVAHQIVSELRRGDYSIEGGRAPTFRRIALAGQSTGAQIANIEAYSYRDIDALIIVALSPQTTPRASLVFGETREVCLKGGEPSRPGGPGGYAFTFGQTPAAFKSTIFHKARKSVVEAVIALRNRDPCGDDLTLLNALLKQRSALPKIKVPVLVICGENDALFVRRGCAAQKALYSGSRSASLALVPRAGHAPMLERAAPIFRTKVSRWLEKRRF